MNDDDSDMRARKSVRGRGTGELAKGRFERLEVQYEPGEEAQVQTEVFRDASRSILSFNDSPDVGFEASFNPYRGCEHGCIYCYARPTHEYLGLSAGLEFETKLFAKTEAPALLRQALQAKNWTPRVVVASGVTDCYQPIEKQLRLTRQCLEVLAEFRNPAAIITKNFLVTRDLDLFADMARRQLVHVTISITTLDKQLARVMEPRASRPDLRLRAVRMLSDAGVPVSVNIAPVVPGLTDHEIPAILKAAAEAGAQSAHYVLLRLPHGVKDLFQAWLGEHYPDKQQKVINRIRETRGGELYDSSFGERMKGTGIYAEHIARLFAQSRKRYGLDKQLPPLATQYFRRGEEAQLSLL